MNTLLKKKDFSNKKLIFKRMVLGMIAKQWNNVYLDRMHAVHLKSVYEIRQRCIRAKTCWAKIFYQSRF